MDIGAFGKVKVRKQDEQEKKFVWNEQSVLKVKEQINQGYKPKNHPFYSRDGIDVNWRKGEIVYEYTKEEKDEIKKCKKDIIYFAEKYCMLMTDDGYQNIKLRDYQKDLLRLFQKNRNSIVLASRQIGKTTTTTIFLAWFLCFHYDKNCFFLANKNATVLEIVSKTIKVMQFLPFFLKPGAMNKTQSSLVLDNGSRLKSASTTKNSAIGDTIHLLYIDEFAHIDPSIQKEFWDNVYPTLSSSGISRIILTSTPNGRNLFHTLYKGSLEKRNTFANMRIDWWMVPGRDEKWKQEQIADLGGGEIGEEAFNWQYGCQFISASSLLLSALQLKKLDKQKKEYEFREMDVFDEYNIDYVNLKWNKEFSLSEINKINPFIISIDTAEGEEGDYSIANIFKLVLKPKYDKLKKDSHITEIYNFFQLKQVGLYRINTKNVNEFSKFLYILLAKVFNPELIKIVLEWNTYGSDLYSKLTTTYGENNVLDDTFFVKYEHTNEAKIKKVGIKLRKGYKANICSDFKNYVDKDYIILNESKCVEEAFGFGKNKKGNYQGQLGHDDIIMSAINASSSIDTEEYKNLIDDYYDTLDEKIQKVIDQILEKEIIDIEEDIYDIYENDGNINRDDFDYDMM